MNLQRTRATVVAPGWKLSTVLDFLERDHQPPSEIMKMRKAAFLLLLATGWRISELHACARNNELCRFTENNTLLIRPHPLFLAKNELRKRMTFREIKLLKITVRCNKQYLSSDSSERLS